MVKVLESFKTWLKSVNEAWAPDVAVSNAPAQRAEAPDLAQVGGRLQSGATVGIFALLVLYFLYFASPILIPIITALLLSMLLAPFVRLLEWVRVPRTLGALSRDGGRRNIVWPSGRPQSPSSELAHRTKPIRPS